MLLCALNDEGGRGKNSLPASILDAFLNFLFQVKLEPNNPSSNDDLSPVQDNLSPVREELSPEHRFDVTRDAFN